MKYEEFLDRVKDTCDEYSEIQDLVTRHDTLECANRDLMCIQTDSESLIEELRNDFQNYRKEQEMEMLAFTNQIASLSSVYDDSQKIRQDLETMVDRATQEGSKHSLYFGQILMSVENLYLRCATRKKILQHDQTQPMDDEGPKGRDADEQEDSEDSFRKKKQTAVRHLKVILDYLKDFKEITETLRKERRGDPSRTRAAQQETVQREPTIVVETTGPTGGDRASQNSGSQGNTRYLPRGGGLAGGDTSG